jgi:Ca2+-binding RTX toxin-like protein
MAITYPSAQDQYMLELINRGRLDPEAEADLYLNGDLNEGLDDGTISTAAKQPLAFNLNLNAAAEGHSQWMLDNNTFSHTGEGGSSSGQRMENAGYSFTGAWGRGENIAWVGTTGTPNFTAFVEANYENLFIDENYPGRGHRVNLMNGNFQEIGLSSLQGGFTPNSTTYNAVMTTQDFAYSSNRGPFITGVAYTDAVTDNDFYTVGEGLQGITVTAVDTANNANTFTTTTWSSGGYSLEVAAGATYTVSFSGDFDEDNQTDTVNYQVTVAAENVKQDLVTDSIILTPQPTTGDDDLTYTAAAETIDALAGNDIIRANGGSDNVFGNDGHDKLYGQGGGDTLIGGTGNDTVSGGGGNDTLIGVDEGLSRPGAGERDVLMGGNNADLFVLGNQTTVFYDDEGTTVAAGNASRALIKDFAIGVDQIQLSGSASDYQLKETAGGNTNIFFQPAGEVKDLIAIVNNTTGLNLADTSTFSFV